MGLYRDNGKENGSYYLGLRMVSRAEQKVVEGSITWNWAVRGQMASSVVLNRINLKSSFR